MRKGRIVAIVCVVRVVLLLLPQVAWATLTYAKVEFPGIAQGGAGAIYQMRWGLNDPEGSDLIPLSPLIAFQLGPDGMPVIVAHNAGCFKLGSQLKVRVTVDWAAPPPPLLAVSREAISFSSP